ncbi:hypothetical protein [Streptomyces sp. NPDC001678]|uniref:hypothetical protein n=1 Tax=Streptomyces sp. NPDC001678 TaxID=3364599 RepID=UPI003678DE5E
MSESMGTGETSPQEESKAAGTGIGTGAATATGTGAATGMAMGMGTGKDKARTGAGRAGRWVRRRSVRWVAAGAAVLVIGGGAAAVAHHHEGEEGHGHGHDRRTAADDRGPHDGRDGWGSRGGRGGQGDQGGWDDRDGGDGRQEDGRAPHAAPAPLPSTNAADAATKAASAVAGGKVESLSPVAEQGGGRSWRIVVLGPDGVRHAVTIDGAGDTITGNTVLGG